MNIFRRVEQKYILSEDEYNNLMKNIIDHIHKDVYFKSTVCNIYFDTDNSDLIVNSLEKPLFKQKVRLRSYNIPKKCDNCFLELKGKYDGVVFKRRVNIKLDDYYKYIDEGKIPDNNNEQIMNEIDYIVKKYNLKPKIYLAYDRESYYDIDDKDFRITFDTNLRSRVNDLHLESGDSGDLYSNKKFYIMELKSLNSIPLWFIDILSKLKIYTKSFSKYGNIYKNMKEGYNV